MTAKKPRRKKAVEAKPIQIEPRVCPHCDGVCARCGFCDCVPRVLANGLRTAAGGPWCGACGENFRGRKDELWKHLPLAHGIYSERDVELAARYFCRIFRIRWRGKRKVWRPRVSPPPAPPSKPTVEIRRRRVA